MYSPKLQQMIELAEELSADERDKLVTVVQAMGSQTTPKKQGYDWRELRGIAPNMLGGEDAQEWVTRTRKAAGEARERQWEQPQ